MYFCPPPSPLPSPTPALFLTQGRWSFPKAVPLPNITLVIQAVELAKGRESGPEGRQGGAMLCWEVGALSCISPDDFPWPCLALLLLLSTWLTDVNQHRQPPTQLPGARTHIYTVVVLRVQRLFLRLSVSGRREQLLENTRNFHFKSLAMKHLSLISAPLIQTLSSLHPGLGLYLSPLVWN